MGFVERVARWRTGLSTRWVRLTAGYGAAIGALVYISVELENGVQQLARANTSTTQGFIGLLSGAVLTLVLSAFYHVQTVRRIERTNEHWLKIAAAYAIGQIVRYLPGKVAGVAFQAGYLSGRLRLSTITVALISQTIVDNVWTLAFAGGLLMTIFFESPWALMLPVATLCLLLLAHRRAWVERALTYPAGISKRLSMDMERLARGPHRAVAPTAALAVVWFPLLIGFAVFVSPALAAGPALVLGASYLIATVGSMLFFIVPSGIVVREALFIWIGTQFGVETAVLVYCGIAMRVALTLAEVASALLFYVLDIMRGAPNTTVSPE